MFLFFFRFATDIDVVYLSVIFELGVAMGLKFFLIVFLDLLAYDKLLKLLFFLFLLHLLSLVYYILIVLFVLLFLVFA